MYVRAQAGELLIPTTAGLLIWPTVGVVLHHLFPVVAADVFAPLDHRCKVSRDRASILFAVLHRQIEESMLRA